MKNEIVLKMENQFDIVKLRNKLDEIIGGDNSIGISMKWRDIAEILLASEIKGVDEK